MRTRSSKATEPAKKGAQKRKRNDDDPAVGDAGHKSKRCKVAIARQSMASRAQSPLKKKLHNSADPERTSSTSKNGDADVFEMTLENFVGSLRVRGAADRSSRNPTGGKIYASLKKAIAKNPGTAVSPVASTYYGEDGLRIIDTPLSPGEAAGEQCQSHEDGFHDVEDTALVKGKTERRSCRKKRRASLGGCFEESKQGEQNGSHTTLPERRLKARPSAKRKCCPGNVKQFKNQRKGRIGSRSTEVSQTLNSSYSGKRLNAAKSRWKSLARSILSGKISPETLASDLTRSTTNTTKYKKTPLPRKQRKLLRASNASTADQRPVTGRIQLKVRKKQLSLLKRMRTWLNEANFVQGANKETSSNDGEEFIMTEDARSAFAKTMVQSCQKNPNMRTVFLESVRMLTLSGLMQAAASNLLCQGPCEEAQNVMNAWADFKEKSATTKTLPMNLLTSINQLHENRGDLSTKLSTQNVVGIFTLAQIDEKTWKFQLPGSPPEDSVLSKSFGQDIAT